MIENICALAKLKKLEDNSQDFIFGDPPYALGSTVYVDKDGKPKYRLAKDFMSKWEMPDHTYWEEFFKVAEQKLKFGGRILFFGIDRQLFLFQYYAVAAGFEIKQSLYWYFISNFPKATDLSKQAGFNKELFSMSELDAEFVAIAETRRKAWRNLDITKLDENKKHIEKRSKEHKKQEGLFDAD